MASQFHLLKSRRFLPLFMTQFLGAFNDNVFKNALIILMTFMTAEQLGMDPRILVTAAAGIFILPFFLFSALAGQLVDKNEKSRFIWIIKLAEIILMLLATLGFYLENIYILMTVLFLMGTQSSFFGPVKYSILPDHLKKHELIGGNGLIEAGTFLAILVGTIFGGVLIMQEAGVYIVSAMVVFMSILGWWASWFIPHARPAAPHLKVNYNIVTETWSIIKRTKRKEDVFLSIIGISWFWLVGFTFLAQFPIFGKEVFGGNEHIVTLFLTVFSIGVAVGSLVCARLLKGEVSGTYVPYGAAGMSLFILLLWFVSPKTIATGELIGISAFIAEPMNIAVLVCMGMIAVCSGIYIVPLYAIMQSRSEASHRSRTVAANNILNSFFMVIGALISMKMLEAEMRVVDIFLVVGLANIPVCFLVRYLVKKQQAKREKRAQRAKRRGRKYAA